MKRLLIVSISMLAMAGIANAHSSRKEDELQRMISPYTCQACAAWGATMLAKKPNTSCSHIIAGALHGNQNDQAILTNDFWEVCPQTNQLMEELWHTRGNM
jgi:hypothetical protein